MLTYQITVLYTKMTTLVGYNFVIYELACKFVPVQFENPYRMHYTRYASRWDSVCKIM